MRESKSHGIEHGDVPYVPIQDLHPANRETSWQQAEITAPDDEQSPEVPQPGTGAADSAAPAEAVNSVSEVSAAVETIDPVAAEAELEILHSGTWPAVSSMRDLVEQKGDDFWTDFFGKCRNKAMPWVNRGYFDDLETEVQVLQEMAQHFEQADVEAVTAQLMPAIEKGKTLEPVVTAAAAREIRDHRSWLTTRPDWDKVVDAYLTSHSKATSMSDNEDSVARHRTYGILFTGIEHLNADDWPSSNYRRAAEQRNALRRLSAEIVERDDILPADQLWEAPEDWRPNPAFGTETRQWTREVLNTKKFLAPARQEVFEEGSFSNVRKLATLGERSGLRSENAFYPPGVPRPPCNDLVRLMQQT
jgi:hypothetical protein